MLTTVHRDPVADALGQRPVVVLAPMAGVTNRAFRRVCREASAAIAPGLGAALYVSEMITSRALIERDAETLDMVRFGEDEPSRSLQLYGVDPDIVGRAVAMVAAEDLADHVDLNFGCPVPKVTRRGGGSALPWKTGLFRAIVRQAVQAAVRPDGAHIPVTVKMRVGIDEHHITFLDAGRVASEEGVAWVALHGRTAAQFYSGHADWARIGELKTTLAPLGTPVLGNGDIWGPADAARMLEQTGVDGVVVGRGCLGRPWLFGQLAAALRGEAVPPSPSSGDVIHWMRRHLELLIAMHEESPKGQKNDPESVGCTEMRKHMAWYLKGFVVGSDLRAQLAMISSLEAFDDLTSQIDPDQQYSVQAADQPRGRTNAQKQVALPQGWLDDREVRDQAMLAGAELNISGG
jgi:nifR3 family TIM-barrel protein